MKTLSFGTMWFHSSSRSIQSLKNTVLSKSLALGWLVVLGRNGQRTFADDNTMARNDRIYEQSDHCDHHELFIMS